MPCHSEAAGRRISMRHNLVSLLGHLMEILRSYLAQNDMPDVGGNLSYYHNLSDAVLSFDHLIISNFCRV